MRTKHLLLALFILVANALYSQFFVEGFAKFSTPSNSIFSSDEKVELIDFSENPFTVSRSDLFTAIANPQFGGGASMKYFKNNWATSLQIGYVEYKSATPLLRLSSFQVVVAGDYYFSDGPLSPYVGAQVGMFSFAAQFIENYVLAQDLTETHFGLGPRLGLRYSPSDSPWGILFHTCYVFEREFPFVDIGLGIEYDLGDF